MSHNLTFAYVRGALEDAGRPLTADEVVEALPQFGSEQIAGVLAWALADGSVLKCDGVYRLPRAGAGS